MYTLPAGTSNWVIPSIVEIFEGKGVNVGTRVKVGCTVGTGIVAVGVSVLITTTVDVSATTGVVALGPKLHAARRRERKKIIVFFI
jgi:hypothetical protein